MKNLVICFVMLMLIGVGSNNYAQERIPYQEHIQPVVQTQIVYVQQPQPVVVYQWIPYVSQQNVIVEQQRLFYRTQTVVTRPYTQWILQPVVIYR
jgi:hypothetical protein